MRLLLALALVLGVATASACHATRTAEIAVSTVTLAVTGMTCPVECPPKVHLALARVPGVERVAVDFNARSATVTGRGVERSQLVAALEQAGFGAGE
jgi:copper chaperone CopZ